MSSLPVPDEYQFAPPTDLYPGDVGVRIHGDDGEKCVFYCSRSSNVKSIRRSLAGWLNINRFRIILEKTGNTGKIFLQNHQTIREAKIKHDSVIHMRVLSIEEGELARKIFNKSLQSAIMEAYSAKSDTESMDKKGIESKQSKESKESS